MRRSHDSVRRAVFGYTWRGIVRPSDREMGIAGGELIALDLRTNEVLGVRRNYMQSRGLNWLVARQCPQLVERSAVTGEPRRPTNFDFLSKVLVPADDRNQSR